jgi:holo-[acyl-carrier protein] synthase
MPIIGIGIDIVHIPRIAQSIERFGDRFLQRIYHPEEIAFSQKRKKNAEFLAGCFAVKEALLKALSDFPGRGVSWADIYITHAPTGQPILHYAGKIRELCEEKGVQRSFVSITHDGDLAVAQVVLEG